MANPRLLSSYSDASACRWARTSSTGSSSAEARDISVTGSSITIRTASIAARAPPAKSLMSKATCSCGISVGTSLNLFHRLLAVHVVELVADTDLAAVLAGPQNRQLSESLALVEADHCLLEQLQQRQETRDDHQRAVGIVDHGPGLT